MPNQMTLVNTRTLLIEFYDREQKVAVEETMGTLDIALRKARIGLAAHNARHALVLEMGKLGDPLGIVHRDLLP